VVAKIEQMRSDESVALQDQSQMILFGGRIQPERRQIVDDPGGARGKEVRVGGGGAQGQDSDAGGLARADAGGSVFDDDAVIGGKAQKLRGFEIGLGVGLAAEDVIGADQVLWEWEAGSADADFSQTAGARGGDGPAILRKNLKELERAGEGNYAVGVFDFAALDFAIFGFMIGVGQEVADGGDTGAAMSLANDLVGDEAVLVGPDGPDASNGGSGVNQDAI
jgi:hypothetical protein